MSHPKEVKLFVPWAKAMVQGAIVGKPNYGKTRRKRGSRKSSTSSQMKRRKRRKKKRNAQA